MIQRLGASSVNFGASEVKSARDSYTAQIDKNLQTAQKQNNIITTLLSQIPMQGTAQKLDVIV